MTNEQLDLAARIERMLRITNPYGIETVSTRFTSSKRITINVTYRPMNEDLLAILDNDVCKTLQRFFERRNWGCDEHLKEDRRHMFKFKQYYRL